ncbi:hypothetical protein PSHT_15194 [Puccinia striiformis]|nr:hypothetical protein PSHT_15194 [Puccinia striiformis]
MSSDQLDTLGGLADNIEGGLGGMIEDDLRDLSNKAEEGVTSYYKDWLFVWHSQLTLAINNFIQACRGFESDPDQ